MIKLRPDAGYDIANAIAQIQEPLHKCCFTCENADVEKSLCKKYNQTPPMKVITFGCPEWVYNDIPF